MEEVDRKKRERKGEVRSVLDNMFEKMAEGQQNVPFLHYVPGSVLGARNTVVNTTDTGASRSVGPELRRVAWTK